MVKGVWTFEVPQEKQEEYLKITVEVIKPFWEDRGCISYQVFQDYTNPHQFVKEQVYPDKESLDRDIESALDAKDPEAKRKELTAEYGETIATPYVAASKGYVDAVIFPDETRSMFIRGLKASRSKREARPQRKHGNIPL